MTASAREFSVDGERFLVTEATPGNYHFVWDSGPNNGYGFDTTIYPPAPMTDEQVTASIHDFLAEIDPQTGYLAD